MISALKGALSGSLETVILGLMKSTAQFDASEIKESIKVKCGLFVFSFFQGDFVEMQHRPLLETKSHESCVFRWLSGVIV